jgi:hypothetical protein
MITAQGIKKFQEVFKGSDKFYLADPEKVTTKKNGGQRWAVQESSYKFPNLTLEEAIQGHLDGTLRKGVVLPPIRKSDNKCIWGAIDIDGNIYKDDKFKKELLDKVRKFNLPLTACFSKSKGLHLYIRFKDWTDAKIVVDILHTFLKRLELPPNTECFPKQTSLKGNEIGNGIMLPHMYGVGNNAIRDHREPDGSISTTNSPEQFVSWWLSQTVEASEIEIDLPKPEKKKDDYETDNGLSKWEILKGIKNNTIEEHPTMGGKYHSWIQVVIAKAVKGGWGDNEILKLIKEVHQDNRGIGYVWPESYQKQINYTRRENRLNKPNPGDTNFLEKQNLETASKLEEIKKSYCYVKANDMFYQFGTTEFYLAPQINNYHKHEVFIEKGTLTNKLLGSRNFSRAETFITSARFKPGIIKIDKPGIVPMMSKGVVLNIYIPNYLEPKEGDVKFVIDFFIWLIGEDKWRIIEQWIAFMLQKPGVKMKWAVVLVSEVEGVGKGLLARICSRVLGQENVNENANYKHLTNTHNTLLVGTQLLVLNEVSLGDFKSKAEGTNTLKNFVADDVYSCNFKNKPMIKLPNLTNFMILSNDVRVLSVNDGARRYYFCNIKKTEEDIIQKSDSGEFQRLWDFADSDEGASALLDYFKNKVEIGDPTIFFKRAPQTDDLKELIEQSKHPVIKKLEYDLYNKRSDTIPLIFNGTFSGLATFEWLNDKLSTPHDHFKFDWGSYGDDAIYKFLSSNCTRWNNGENTRQIEIGGHRQRFYLLDDTRCPFPDKSYKDLTPKVIEVIYKNYSEIRKEIREEEDNYEKARNNLSSEVEDFKENIQGIIWSLDRMPNSQRLKKFKGKTADEIWEGLLKGTIKLDKDYELEMAKKLKQIQEFKRVISKGVRTPEEIIAEYPKERKVKVSNY